LIFLHDTFSDNDGDIDCVKIFAAPDGVIKQAIDDLKIFSAFYAGKMEAAINWQVSL
jgi:hypothetical protein